MSSAVALRREATPRYELSLFDRMGGEPTLDDLLAGVWEGLTAHRDVACPVCGGRMLPDYGAHARPRGGRCSGCGASLS